MEIKKNSIGIGGVILIILLVLFGISKCISQKKMTSPKKEKVAVEQQLSSPTVKTIPVFYGKEYGDPIHLPGGYSFNFLEATTPYCVKNGDGFENCGSKGEDVAMGNSSSNKTLYFKGNESGTLIIELTKK